MSARVLKSLSALFPSAAVVWVAVSVIVGFPGQVR
jgi:hypothetical protein